MKGLFIAALLWVAATPVIADPGIIDFSNTGTTRVSTNATSVGGGIGFTSPALGGFIYALFTAPYGIGAGNPDLVGGPWIFTGVYATNTILATGGRLAGGGNVAVPTGWLAGATNDFKLAGWSSNLGLTWAAVEPQFATGNWVDFSGFFGQSSIGFGIAGGPAEGGFPPPFSLFGAAANPQGNPLTSGFTLYSVVPEPSTLALLAVGGVFFFRGRRR